MPPAKKTAPAKAVRAAVKPAETATLPETQTAVVCGLCWPQGWPDEAHHASCEHGEYDR